MSIVISSLRTQRFIFHFTSRGLVNISKASVTTSSGTSSFRWSWRAQKFPFHFNSRGLGNISRASVSTSGGIVTLWWSWRAQQFLFHFTSLLVDLSTFLRLLEPLSLRLMVSATISLPLHFSWTLIPTARPGNLSDQIKGQAASVEVWDEKATQNKVFSFAHYWRSIVMTSLHFKGHTKVVLLVRNSCSRTHQFRLRVMR